MTTTDQLKQCCHLGRFGSCKIGVETPTPTMCHVDESKNKFVKMAMD